MKIIFIFIDGFGLGEKDKSKNPIFAAVTPNINYITENCRVIPTDTTMCIQGLPQSATGQTAIFTGVNASKVLGRHMHGQPTITLKRIINENNLFKELLSMGLKVTNANVYRRAYLDNMREAKDKRARPSVTSIMTMSGGINFRTVEDYNKGQGVYHDITGKILADNGFTEKAITPKEAARRLYLASREYDFTLFEHFMTDTIGHRSDMEFAVSHIEMLDEFLGGLLEFVNLDKEIIFITSDHGNIEDMSVKTHTLNKVPTIICGKLPESITDLNLKIVSLTDIVPAIVEIFKGAK